MEKTKLGLSVGIVAALLYFCGLFGGYVATILLALYVLICEDSLWLRKSAVRALTLLVGFSLAYALIGFVPEFVEIIRSLLGVFGIDYFTGIFETIFSVINNLVSFVASWIDVVEKVAFLAFAIMAIFKFPGKLPLVDKLLVEKEEKKD